MKFLKKLRRRWQLDRDLEEELAFHLEQSGRARFGNPTSIKETCRELWMFTAVESWWQDVSYAARTLAKTKGMTVTAVTALAFGIGINTSVYTVFSRALDVDLGIRQPERLVVINIDAGHDSEQRSGVASALPDLQQIRLKSIDLVTAYRVTSMNVSDRTNLPEREWGAEMTESGFEIMSRQPVLGRSFTAADETPGAQPVAVISHRLWQNRYGGDPTVIGRTIRVDDVPRAVIGVMPPNVTVPEGVDLWIPPDPLSPNPAAILARLAPGATIGAARAEVESLTRALINKYQDRLPGLISHVHFLLDEYGRYANRPLYFAQFTAVAFVLLIACADVANLLLARSAARGREISIRIAIGAGRARIIRQLLIESVLLSSLGGFFGWLIALATLGWFDRKTIGMGRPDWIDFSMDARVFAYLAAISIGAGILFGLAPALRLAKVDVNGGVKDGGSAMGAGVRGRRLANLLVAVEMALVLVLLAGAGLLIRSSLHVYNAPLGVNPANILTMHVNLPAAKYPRANDQIAFHQELQRRLEALPSVESAGAASAIPCWGFGMRHFTGRLENGQNVNVEGLTVTAGYFRALQIPSIRGRRFDATASDELIVNAAFAGKYWPGEDAVGKRVQIGAEWRNVVGVVTNVQQDSRRLDPMPLIYLPYREHPERVMFLIARTAVPPATLADAFRREAQKMDENLPLYDVSTLERRIAQNRLNTGALGVLFTLFAAIALLLASVGLYAVIAHAVSQRTREIGVRMALGGSRRNILALVLVQGMWPVAVGLALGLPAAIGLTRVLRSALVGVSPGDPVTFGGVLILLAAVGALGCAIPARRALRVDPVVALRHE